MATSSSAPADAGPFGTKTTSSESYARPDKLLTTEELYEVRFLTNFLQWTNPIDSTSGKIAKVEDDHPDKPTNDCLGALGNVLVRNNELMALTTKEVQNVRILYEEYDDWEEIPTDDAPSDSDEEDETNSKHEEDETHRTAIKGEDVERYKTLASNNVRDTNRFDEAIPRGAYPPLEISLVRTSHNEDLGDSATQWLLNRTLGKARKTMIPDTDVTFQEHIGNVVFLIKATYNTKAERDRARAFRRLRDYVLLHSCSKIADRISRGSLERDFFKYASTFGRSLDIDVEARSSLSVRNFIDNLPKRERDTLCAPFTADEEKVISLVVEALKCGAKDEIAAANEWRDYSHLNNPSSDPVWRTKKSAWDQELAKHLCQYEEYKANISSSGGKLRYNARFIPFFQTMIAGILANVRSSFENVKIWKQILQKYRQVTLAIGTSNNEAIKERTRDAADEVDIMVHRAGEWMGILTLVLCQLRPYVKANLGYLREVYGLTNLMPKPSQDTQPQAPVPRMSAFVATPSTPGQGKESSTFYQLNAAVGESSPVPSGESQSGQSEEVIRTMNKMKINDDGEGKRESDDDQIASKSTWEDAVLAWLDLVCLHLSGIMTLACKSTPNTFDKRVGMVIQNVNIDLIKATVRYRDTQVFISDYLKTFRMATDAPLTDNERETIMEWTRNEGQIEGRGRGFAKGYLDVNKEMENFSGTYHCETMMMVLFLLDADYDEIVDLGAEVDPKDPLSLHLKLPPRDVTAKFKGTLDILQASRRCCPACSTLVEHVVSYHKDMIHPGHHTQWFPVSLPSFTEAKAGRAVLNAARQALQARFMKILEVMRSKGKNKASPAHSYKSDASPVDTISFDQQSVDIMQYASPAASRSTSLQFRELEGIEDIADTTEISPTHKASSNIDAKRRKKAEKQARRAEERAKGGKPEPLKAAKEDSTTEGKGNAIGKRERASLTPGAPSKPLKKKGRVEGEAGRDGNDAPMADAPLPAKTAE